MPAAVKQVALACSLAVALAASAGRAQGGRPSPAPLETALREANEATCPGHPVQLDPDLTRAAQRYVQAVKSGAAQADGAELSFFASLESIDPSPTGGVATINHPAQADRAVGDLLPKSCRYTHAGVASASLPDGLGVVAVLTASRALDLEAIPAQVAPGAAVRVEGRLTDAQLTSPRLYHLVPSAQGQRVEETPLELSGRRFSLEVPLVQPGEHALEVLADGAGGPQVIALRRVFVGVEPPASPPAAAAPLASGGDELAQVERAIAQLRAARGLPALTRDPALDAVAAGHSREMARTQTFAHVLKSDGSLVDRLLRAGYANHFAGENIGLAETAPAAHKAIEESPAHLMNLLDPRHSRLGLGEAAGISPDGDQAIYLTEVLAQPVVGSRDPAGEIAALIGAERTRRKLPALVRDPRLDALAQARIRKVAALAGKSVEPDIAQQALEAIGSLSSAAAERLVAGSPDDVKLSKDASGRDWAIFGVGAVYATSKEYGPDRLWILLLFAR